MKSKQQMASMMVALGLLLTAGCSSIVPPVAFERDQISSDRLPAPVTAAAGIEADSVRFIDEWGDGRVYIGRSVQDSSLCVLVENDTADVAWAGACGKNGSDPFLSFSGIQYMVTDKSHSPIEGWIEIDKGVYSNREEKK